MIIVTHYVSLACLSHASCMPLGLSEIFLQLGQCGNAGPAICAIAVISSCCLIVYHGLSLSHALSCFSIKPSLNLLGIHFQWHFQLERQGVLHNSNQFTEGFLS